MNIVYVGTVASQIMVILEMWQILATRFIEVVQLMIILTQLIPHMLTDQRCELDSNETSKEGIYKS